MGDIANSLFNALKEFRAMVIGEHIAGLALRKDTSRGHGAVEIQLIVHVSVALQIVARSL